MHIQSTVTLDTGMVMLLCFVVDCGPHMASATCPSSPGALSHLDFSKYIIEFLIADIRRQLTHEVQVVLIAGGKGVYF